MLHRAAQVDIAAIDGMLRAVQPGVVNLAVRILGNREDGAYACQEVLMKAIMH